MDKSSNVLENVFKNLELDDVITQAILKTMSEEAKEKMMQGIMTYLTKVEGDSYYNKKTVLENIFNNSIRDQVSKTMHEVVAADTRISDKCREIAEKSIAIFMQRDVNEMIKVMVDRMANAFEAKDTKYY